MPEKLSSGPKITADLSRVSSGLTRGANQRKKLNGCPWVDRNTFPMPGATIDLDFVNDRSFVKPIGTGNAISGLVFTRACRATYMDANGVLRTTGDDIVTRPYRRNYNIFRDSTEFMAGVAWTVSSATKTNATDPNGTLYGVKVIFSVQYASLTHTLINSLLVGTTYTASFWARRTDAGTNTLSLATNTGNVYGSFLPTSEWTKFTITFTVTGSASQNQILFQDRNTSGWTSVELAFPKLEVGSVATDFVATDENNWISITEDFSLWLNSSTTVATSNAAIAPDGNTTASLVYPLTTGANRRVGYAWLTSINSSYRYTVYAKAAGMNWFALRFAQSTQSAVWFDLSTGSIGTTVNTTGEKITPVGDGWYRCEMSIFAPQAQSDWRVEVCDADNTTTGTANGTNGIYLWGAQIESIPSTAYAPRFDWQNHTLENRKNRASFTENFSYTLGAVPWGKASCVVTADQNTAPDGLTTADKITANAATSLPYVNNNATPYYLYSKPGDVITFSVFVKYINHQYVATRIADNSGTFYVIFDLVNGVVSYNQSPTTYSDVTITPYADGWYRLSITKTIPLTPPRITPQTWCGVFLMGGATNVNNWTATGTEAVYVWGAQLEYGPLTDYKPTSAFVENRSFLPNSRVNGLMIEFSRANRCLWCRDLTKSQWIKTNVEVTLTGTGIDGVANVCSEVTSNAANAIITQTVTATSLSFVSSIYLKRKTGTGKIYVTIDGATWTEAEISDTEWRRIALHNYVTTTPVIGIKFETSGDSVLADYAQVEAAATNAGGVSSPIYTTTAMVTRATDSATITGGIFDACVNIHQGTMYANGAIYTQTAAAQSIAGIDTPTSLYVPRGVYQAGFVAGTISATFSEWKFGEEVDVAVSHMNRDGWIAAKCSGVLNTGISPNTVPAAMPRVFRLGVYNATTNTFGSVNRVVYFPYHVNLEPLSDMVR